MNKDLENLLKPLQMVHLATCEADQPRLRPMTLIFHGGRFWFATGSADQKSLQLDANPKAEFCLLLRSGDNSGYLRGSGAMDRIDDPALRKAVADAALFIYDYFRDADDPGYRLYEMKVARLGLMEPGEMYERELELR
jgi:general stress protein 26